MKLLIYSNFFMPIPGGTQTIVLELARGLSSRHVTHPGLEPIEVTVVTQTELAWEGDKTATFRIVRCPTTLELTRLLWGADVVHLAGPALLPLSMSLLLRKPTIIEHHSFSVACPNGQFFYEPTGSLCPNYFLQSQYAKCVSCNKVKMSALKSVAQVPLTLARRWLSNRASVNVMPTEWISRILALSRSTTIQHGISDTGARSDIAAGGTFGFQGRLVTTKGIELLIDAVNKLHDMGISARLKIIGAGPQLENLKGRAARRGAEISFLGHVEEEKLADALSDVSTIVMPSLAGEVFGLVALENMLRGKLVLVSDLGSLKEVVGDAGLTHRNGDVDDLTRRMKDVLDDPSIAKSLGPAAQTRARDVFSLDLMVENHLKLYQRVLEK
jgi:glycogen synthase